MTRLLLALPLAFVPALVAAPVPRDTRPAFGASGLLSRADLEQVRFDSRAMKPDDRRVEEREDAREEKDVEDIRKRTDDQPERPRPANKFDVAVHMPRKVFREGEPVPAYLVLRNNRPSMLGLNSRIDLSGVYPEMAGSGISFDVRDLATGKSALKGLSASTNCGGGSLTDVPADGYFVTRGDLGQLSGGLLPAGEYEVQWGYRPLKSAPVRFSVTKSDAAKPPASAPRPLVHFFHLSEGGEVQERLRFEGEPHIWYGCRLESRHTESMAAALAVGQTGAYVPDIFAIPVADGVVEAWAEWRQYREEDRLIVTLRAAAPHKVVWFDELPHLHLQIESPRDAEDRDWSRCSCPDMKAQEKDSQSLVTPLTIEARLPKDWRERVGVKDSARVAVLVTSKELEMPCGADRRLKKAVDVAERLRRAYEEPPPIWSGTVRTDFVELNFPARPPRATP
jgi:hypothetical protein